VNLDELSVVSLWSAMAVYALAFIAFALDLAKRSAEVSAYADEQAAQASGAGATTAAVQAAQTSRTAQTARAARAAAAGSARPTPASETATIERVDEDDSDVTPQRSVTLRIGVALTVIGFLLHATADVTRGISAGRVPWANMYEFAMTGTLLIVMVFLIVIAKTDVRFLGTFVTGLVLILLGVSSVNYYVSVVPLPPPLQSAWLIIHVFVASLGTAFFGLGFALSVVQLLQHRREIAALDLQRLRLKFLATLPSSERLENMAYRVNIVGFIFWTFTLMAGSIWAQSAWGRYWGWDTKEVWTFIIWVIYAGYLHARSTRGWRGSPSAWLAIVGFSAVMFNFTIVNIFFKGLHSYSGLPLD